MVGVVEGEEMKLNSLWTCEEYMAEILDLKTQLSERDKRIGDLEMEISRLQKAIKAMYQAESKSQMARLCQQAGCGHPGEL